MGGKLKIFVHIALVHVYLSLEEGPDATVLAAVSETGLREHPVSLFLQHHRFLLSTLLKS